MSEVEVHDRDNRVSLVVEEVGNGKQLQITFPRFEGVPITVTITVPRKSAHLALKSFITDMYVNEDVLLNLLREALQRL